MVRMTCVTTLIFNNLKGLDMNTKWILAMAVAAVMASPAARAEDVPMAGKPDGAHHGMMMEKMDADGNGLISREEFTKMHDERFTKMDTDADGSLSPEEMKKAWEEKRGEMMERHEKKEGMMEGTEGGAEGEVKPE